MSGLGYGENIPEIKIIYGTLLVPHVDVEREEVDWSESPPAQHLKECRQAVSLLRFLHSVCSHRDRTRN